MQTVNVWLSSVFGDQSVPPFEVNTRTVDVLYQLAQSSGARCRESTVMVEELQQKAAEYQAEGSHLQEVLLHGVGVSCGRLSKSATDYVSALVDTGMVLGVRDSSLGSLIPALNDHTNELLEAEKSNRKLERELRALRKKLGATLVLRNNLQEDVKKTTKSQAVEAAKAEEWMLKMGFVASKVKELNIKRDKSEAQIRSRNMDKSVTHQSIVQLSEDVVALKNETIPLQKKLEPYMDLSPNPSLAQVKIEEVKRELAALDSQLEMNVDIK